MALSPFLPATPSSSSQESPRKRLSLIRVRRKSSGSSSNASFHMQKIHHQPREQDYQQKERLKKKKNKNKKDKKQASSWAQLKGLFACRIVGLSQIHDPSSVRTEKNSSKYSMLGSSCSNICKFEDVVHSDNRSVVHERRRESDVCSDSLTVGLGHEVISFSGRRTPSSYASSSKGRLHLRKLPSCYQCHAVSEPRRYPSPRIVVSCPECGDIFDKSESLEMHLTVRHAVSELGADDSGRNIVEIIFKSSWLKKDPPLCHIERILKVNNNQRTVARFEDYRSSIKASAAARHSGAEKKHPRCAADGNELLRFHCCGILCDLGAHGRSSLCSSSSSSSGSPCGVCTIIRHGFGRAQQEPRKGIRITASSGMAHGYDAEGCVDRRAMLVCRVIAGRIKIAGDETATHNEGSSCTAFDSMTTDRHAFSDSVAVGAACTSVEELFLSNPRAILPCFVVIYRVTAA
ncbi:C2H2-like zinc finger protein [Wolffia australiana]